MCVMRSNISIGGSGRRALPGPNHSPRPQASKSSRSSDDGRVRGWEKAGRVDMGASSTHFRPFHVNPVRRTFAYGNQKLAIALELPDVAAASARAVGPGLLLRPEAALDPAAAPDISGRPRPDA